MPRGTKMYIINQGIIRCISSMEPHVKVTPELRKEVVSLKASGLSLSALSKEVTGQKV